MKVKKGKQNKKKLSRTYTLIILIMVGLFIGFILLFAVLMQFPYFEDMLIADDYYLDDIFGDVISYMLSIGVIVIFILAVLKYRLK